MKQYWRIIIIAAIMLAVFIPAVIGDFITVDDTAMIRVLRNAGPFDFISLFSGAKADGLYYRPLLMSTFYLDKYLWSFNPFVMRFENVLLHLASVLIIYWTLHTVLRLEGHKNSVLSLLGALLFGLNPLVTESVCWVSGRSDLLAGAFLFLSTLAIVMYKGRRHWVFLLAAVFAGFCGILSKEVALAFAPGALLLLTANCGEEQPSRRPFLSVWLRPLLLVGIFSGVLAFFVFLRSFAVASNLSTIGKTIQFILNDPTYSGLVAVRLLGFYLKKIFFPWPLSFTILEVDPLYELLGMALLIVCILAFFSRGYAAAFFLTGVFLLAPTFPLAFNQIAWTPYAERYAYISSGFIVPAVILFVRDRRFSSRQWCCGYVLIVSLLVVFATSTWARSKVWQTNETLWKDTLEKNPASLGALTEYGLFFYQSGELNKAISYLKKASSHPRQNFYYDEAIDINLAVAYDKADRFFEAEETYQGILGKTKNKSSLAKEGLIILYEKELRHHRPRADRQNLQNMVRELRAELKSVSSPVVGHLASAN